MSSKQYHSIYFLGIGGIGMSALARFYRQDGVQVAGYDRTRTQLTIELEQEGINIHYQEDIQRIPINPDLVVYTPAIPANSIELDYVKQQAYPLIKRAELLGQLSSGKFTIAVAGTHGKTSITAMIAHLLHTAGIPITAFIGGIALNFNNNLVNEPESRVMIVEADEYDQSFLQLKPDIAVVSSMDADHLDIYNHHERLIASFNAFASGIKNGGVLVHKLGLPLDIKALSLTYSIDGHSDLRAVEVGVKEGKFAFTINGKAIDDLTVRWGVPGRHNIENALAAVAVARVLGIDSMLIERALASFAGVRRRFEYRINTPGMVFIDDYAHHPEELKACISAVRECYPGRWLTGIFQPHLFSRTRDFMDDFARSLELLDELILLDIYPARELPIDGVTSAVLLSKVKLDKKQLCAKHELLSLVRNISPKLLLTLGAGDIDQLVEPLQNTLSKA
ncbi:MAG: UDP-N-acetylmuramate--L-alanine ligase [Bacteroidetes bacterium]|nr:UDP-N-acetylmuramate--L-alanine ligase [Bacteroidota bacterium]